MVIKVEGGQTQEQSLSQTPNPTVEVNAIVIMTDFGIRERRELGEEEREREGERQKVREGKQYNFIKLRL